MAAATTLLRTLATCFIPDDITRQIRTYTRLRADHLSMASSHIQHMHKALTLMNIKVQNVISQLHGVSGMRIITAIVLGERDPERLADLCETSILKTKRDRVVASLKGQLQSRTHLCPQTSSPCV